MAMAKPIHLYEDDVEKPARAFFSARAKSLSGFFPSFGSSGSIGRAPVSNFHFV